jgi:ACT domain-containing protein
VSCAPKVLTVIMADTQRTYISIVHENEHKPYGRRTVQIELTDEQRRQLEPRYTGNISPGAEQYEEVLYCWFEPVKPA